jgi:hypothetical protein
MQVCGPKANIDGFDFGDFHTPDATLNINN